MVEWECDESPKECLSYHFPGDFFILERIKEKDEEEDDCEIEGGCTMDGRKSCEGEDEKRGSLVKKCERDNDEYDTYDIPPVVPPVFLVLDNRYEKYTCHNESERFAICLFPKGVERKSCEHTEESEEWSHNLV